MTEMPPEDEEPADHDAEGSTAPALPRVVDRSRSLTANPPWTGQTIAAIADSMKVGTPTQLGSLASASGSEMAKALAQASSTSALASSMVTLPQLADVTRASDLLSPAIRPTGLAAEFQRMERERAMWAGTISQMPHVFESQHWAAQYRPAFSQLYRPPSEIVGSALSDAAKLFKASGLLAATELRNSLESAQSVFGNLAKIGDQLRALQSPTLEYLERLRSLPERLRKNLLALAEAGWFLDPEMTVRETLELSEDLLEHDPEQADREIAEYFREQADRIEADLVQRHPRRAALLREAFSAHRNGHLFSLSISGFLAQAEGFCFDRTERQLFNKSGPRSLKGKLTPASLERAYLELLDSELPLNAGVKRRREDLPKLNRHAVMHGESVDYATEINSLKSLSFLNFVSHAFDVGWDEEGEAPELKPTD